MPLVVYVLAVGTFLMGTTEFVVAGLLPEMATDFHVTVAEAGLSITVFAFGMIVGAPSMALLTLRLPRQVTLTLALAVFATGHIIVALTGNFAVLLGARFLTAVATGAFWAVASVVAGAAAGPEAHSRALGIVLGGGMLANVLGVPLGAFAGQAIGWRGAFWALAILGAAAAVLVARLVRSTGNATSPSVRSELAVLRSVRLWLVLATCALVTASVLSIYSFISPLLTDRTGLPESAVPIALMIFGLGALIGNVLGGRLGDHHPYRIALITAGLTVLSCVGLCLFSTLPAPTLILFTLLGLVGLSANPTLIALAARFGGDAPTLATAMPTSIFNLGTAIGTGISAATLRTSAGELGPLVVATIAAVLIFVPLLALIRVQRHRPHTPAESTVPADNCASPA